MRSSRIASILLSAQELPQSVGKVHVSGSTPAARALVAVRFALELSATARLVLLCPNDDLAAETAADIEALGEVVLGKSVRVIHFPTWEQSPYSPITPSLRTRFARLAALAAVVESSRANRGVMANEAAPPRIGDEHGALIVVTTLAAACQATIPPEVFRQTSLTLKSGATLDGGREPFLRRLTDAGYLRTDPVEDPGSFAVRGEIVDIFPPWPPGRSRPVRVELFDDQIELIREFDPGTQRTLSKGSDGIKDALLIPPAREILINASTIPRIRERLKARADDLGISRAVRDPLLEAISHFAYPAHSDTWAPFCHESAASLWDFLGDAVRVLWSDELSCLQDWDDFRAKVTKQSAELLTSELVVPPPEQLFPWTPALEARVRAATALYLDRVELASLEGVGKEDEGGEGAASGSALGGPAKAAPEPEISARHRVFVHANSDLGQGSRHPIADLEPKLKLWLKQGFRVIALASTQSQLERIRFLLVERQFVCAQDPGPGAGAGLIELSIAELSAGFRWPAEGLVILTEAEILGNHHVRKQKKRAGASDTPKDWAGLQALSDLAVGDAVVHVDHGIGRYQGLVRLALNGAPSDFLLLEYANKDKLYLPIYRLNVVQKYVGSGEAVALDRLGAQQFAKAKEKVRDDVRKLAIDLIKLYAERKVRPGIRFAPPDAQFREFEAGFAFDETPDQLKAVDDIMQDLESGRVMDRLICGDVGYGKTEVAMRAAFLAVTDGKQVVVLVPTTVLATQHELSFRARFADHPITIESLSRFKSPKEQKTVLENVASGKADIVIGTHRVLSRDVKFRDLGLVIVDEEHRFGVEHKEKLKALKIDTHVLTLTATPIPRTLHMSLSGLRDITLINTPPVDRLPIRTYVSKYDDSLIQRAIEFEINRGGQVFFLHNRVQSIFEIAKRIEELVPAARVVVAHGQMPEKDLEAAMMRFYKKEGNVLVCTAIIESGLDIPSANTILINRADALGLAQLYQIRGRVGRGQNRAYAYLMIPAEFSISDDAKRRLEVIQRFVELGSGFSVASHDLEIRGGGDLLGPQQSGNIGAVGFDLYTELLDEAIRELEGKPQTPEESRREPEIKAPFPAYLPDDYVPDVHQRLSMYRRLSASSDDAQLTSLEEELTDRFGAIPAEAQNLLWLIRIKQLLKHAGVDALTVGPGKVSIQSGPGSILDPSRAIALVSSRPGDFQLMPDSKFVAKVPTGTIRDLYFALETLFATLRGATH